MVMPWLTALIGVLAALVLLYALLGPPPRQGRWRALARRRPAPAHPVRVANAATLLTSPRVRRRITRRRALLAVLGCLTVLALAASATIAGRPATVRQSSETLSSRDIVLCLDTSTSMLTTDARILETFAELLDSFDGERVALVAWNTTAQTMVPLTDDYDLLRDELREVADVLDFTPDYSNLDAYETYYYYFSGTFTDIEASSLIGDGLASCALAFDREVEDRSRTIILASDNQVQDPWDLQIYTLAEAADLATDNNIRLISIYGADPDLLDLGLTQRDLDRARDELTTVTTEHAGLFYEADDASAAQGIVRELEADQVEEHEGAIVTVTSDEPELPAALFVGSVLVLLALAVRRRA